MKQWSNLDSDHFEQKLKFLINHSRIITHQLQLGSQLKHSTVLKNSYLFKLNNQQIKNYLIEIAVVAKESVLKNPFDAIRSEDE